MEGRRWEGGEVTSTAVKPPPISPPTHPRRTTATQPWHFKPFTCSFTTQPNPTPTKPNPALTRVLPNDVHHSILQASIAQGIELGVSVLLQGRVADVEARLAEATAEEVEKERREQGRRAGARLWAGAGSRGGLGCRGSNACCQRLSWWASGLAGGRRPAGRLGRHHAGRRAVPGVDADKDLVAAWAAQQQQVV